MPESALTVKDPILIYYRDTSLLGFNVSLISKVVCQLGLTQAFGCFQ